MPNGVYLISPDGNELTEMKQAGYLSELELQMLIASHPRLLGCCTSDEDEAPRRLLLVKQEMGVPAAAEVADRWSMDHLYIDGGCIPTLIEVKRSTDARIRREVVGQMLDYAANAVVYWGANQLKERFELQWGARAEEQLDAFLDGLELSADEFWYRVNENLQARKIRLVFVADELPPELKRIIEFLNEEMKEAEVLGVELAALHRQPPKSHCTIRDRSHQQGGGCQGNKKIP